MKKKQMKKYYLQGTAEELKIGDMIVLDLTGDMPNGHIRHHHMEVKFLPEIIPLLLEQGVIEEQEVKEKKSKPLSNKDYTIKELIKANETLSNKVNELENVLKKVVELLTISVTDSINEGKSQRNAKKAGRK